MASPYPRENLLLPNPGGRGRFAYALGESGALDRIVLVAPTGLKPATGEILDIFFHTPAEMRDLSDSCRFRGCAAAGLR